MNKHLLIAALASLIILPATFGCKTTEENYRQSYEAAIRHKQEKEQSGLDRETYNRILEEQQPQLTAAGNDSVRTTKGYARQSYGADITFRKYNLVVGAMKQKFNAEAFCDRLRREGFPAYVIIDTKKNYYVVAEAYDSLQAAAAALRQLPDRLSFKPPVTPYVFNTTRIKE